MLENFGPLEYFIFSIFQTYKSGGIVVSDGLGITIRFQNGIGLDNSILQVCFLFSSVSFLLICTNDGKVSDDFLGVFSFSGTRLATVIESNFMINLKCFSSHLNVFQ